MAKSGFVNGSDILLMINGKAVGSCTSHTTTFSSETKERAVKPVASAGISAGLWKKKGVVGLSVSISAEGLRFYNETECGFKELFALWKAGAPVTCKCFERNETAATGGSVTVTPYLEGSFVITSLEETGPAQDDATYSVELENDGQPTTLDESKITGGEEDLGS